MASHPPQFGQLLHKLESSAAWHSQDAAFSTQAGCCEMPQKSAQRPVAGWALQKLASRSAKHAQDAPSFSHSVSLVLAILACCCVATSDPPPQKPSQVPQPAPPLASQVLQ